MISIFFYLLLLSLFNIQQSQKISNNQNDVIVFDNTNLFQTIYNSEDPWLLNLYAPWCGHCNKMASEWAKLATKLKGFIKVAKIDADKYPDFNQLYGLKGYPHIVFIPAGPKDKDIFYEHSGPRTLEAFQKWTFQKIAQHRKTIVERLADEKKWNQFCIGSHSDFCVIFFLPQVPEQQINPQRDIQLKAQRDFYFKRIRSVVKKFNKQPVSFMWAQLGEHMELENKLKIKQQNKSVVLINPMIQRYSVMPKEFTQSNFQQWLKNLFDIKFEQYQGELVFDNNQQENYDDNNQYATGQL